MFFKEQHGHSFLGNSLPEFTLQGRRTILRRRFSNEALSKVDLGKVTGRRFEEDTCNVDVEVNDLNAGLSVIRKVLIEDGVDEGTTVDSCSEEVAKKKYRL